MEFPNTGVRCSTKDCKQLDFLPITCNHCYNVYCKDHFHVSSHACSNFVDNVATGKEKTTTFSCTHGLCTDRSPVEMLCVKCKKHFCLLHRYHGCLEQSEEEKLKELKKWEKPKKEFTEAKTKVDEEVTNKLRKSKNTAIANKIQLMRLKGKSVGPKTVPTNERRYFLIHPPISSTVKIFEGSKGVFVSDHWSIGKVIDSIADSLNISNSNNKSNANKLRMFHYTTGNIVSNQMDMILSDLLKSNDVIDGQDIILEYSNDEKVDCSVYK